MVNFLKIIDLPNPKRVEREPDNVIEIFSGKNFTEHGFLIKKVELRQFIEKTDDKLGPYSLITSFLETDHDSIEMIYEEGYNGNNPLEKAKDFLISNLGVSGLILRSVIALESATKPK